VNFRLNRKKIGKFDVRLNLKQSLLCIGVCATFIISAYYFGYFAGRIVGFEAGRATDLALEPRYKTFADYPPRIEDELVAEVYAKLNKDSLDNSFLADDVRAFKAEDLLVGFEEGLNAENADNQDLAAENNVDADNNALELAAALIAEPLASPEKKEEQSPTLGSLRVTGEPQQVNNERISQESNAVSFDAGAVIPKPPERSFVVSAVPNGWFAQVAAPSSAEDANALASQLRLAGFPVLVERAVVQGQNYFRVLVGPEDNRQQAERLMQQLKREPNIGNDPFIRLIR
jgi:cell division septation protein DedD